MKTTTNIKGQLAEYKAGLRALELGYTPSKPIFSARYDLILDDTKRLMRVQIKYADAKLSNSDGSVSVKLAYEDRKRKVYTYQDKEVDGLIVYIPKIDKLCFFPPRVFVGKEKISIRYAKTKNNQKKGIVFAEDYFW
ncbi:MAG: hypothetical protein HY381_01885 [Candidatus Chisholmbacteria bacterium]|nr:hypothetical protein [Candidatus Chisholmbacteria bacterium]